MIRSRFRSKLAPALHGGWAIGCALIGASAAHAGFPSFEEMKGRWIGSESRLYDRKGELIHEHRSDFRSRRIGWTSIQDISPALRSAVLLSEDRRFFEHHGVDWIALTGAIGQHLLRSSTRGASTISMQVASLIDSSLKPKRLRRNWRQKFDQIRQSIELDRSWSKEQILEAYLNLISFRGELQGVASAAKGLFGKVPSGLDQEESLILAALIRSPEADEKTVIQRACALAEELSAHSACDRVTSLVEKQGLLPRPFPPAIALAPHAARLIAKGAEMRSTLDRRVQAKSLEVLRRHVLSLRDRNMNDAAALVVDNRSGQVLAYVGSIGDLSTAHAVDGVRANRQAGSTLKPFLYSLALERKFLTAASKIDDSVTNISLGPGSIYRPRDFDREYHGGDVTLRSALASSLNVPAVRTLQLVGVGNLVERMRALGFLNLRSEEFYGPSLALGTADVSLWELVNAYRTLANQGIWNELTLMPQNSGPLKPKRIISPEASFIVSDILSDRASRSLTFGMDNPMSLRFWAAAKTGTSKDMRDNWCIGYSSRYTVGVWAGNFSGESMWNVSGVSGAAPAWAEIMEYLHRPDRGQLPQAPRPPRGVIRVQDEWYVRGTEPSPMLAHSEAKPLHPPQITYPVEGLMIARDPDIPADHQRIFFQSSSYDPLRKWVLNGQELGTAGSDYAWKPGNPGDYELKLVSSSGQILDQVRFVVRR